MRLQQSINVFAIILGLFIVSSAFTAFERSIVRDSPPLRWNLVRVLNAATPEAGEKDMVSAYVGVFKESINEHLLRVAIPREQNFGVILPQFIIRPLPEPFTCVPPVVSSCQEPPNTLNPPGYTQANCIPLDPACAQGTCFGVCLDEFGIPFGDPEALAEQIYEYDELTGEIIGITANPVSILANGGVAEGGYCAYEVADRCGGEDGGCAFVLECEIKRVCEGQQCVLRPGRLLVGEELGCESNADCRESHSECLGSQCILVPEPGDDECGVPEHPGCPQCVQEMVPIFELQIDPLTGELVQVQVGEEEICERPIFERTCLTESNDNVYLLKDYPWIPYRIEAQERLWTEPEFILEQYRIDNEYFGTTLGPQCALVHCLDVNGDGKITQNMPELPNECPTPDSWCENETQCGISEIIGVEPPEIGPGVEPVCGDGACDSGEEDSCPVDCILRQDPLPPFPHLPPPGEGLPLLSTCSDTDGVGQDVDGDGVIEPHEFFDSCTLSGESTIICGSPEDCTREFRSQCQGDSCVIVTGPGANQCGVPATPTDTAALDPASCSFNCTALAAQLPGSCSIGSGVCSPEFLSQVWPASETCVMSVVCNGESGGKPFALNDGCLSPPPSDYSVGLFQINLNAGTGRCPAGLRKINSVTGQCVVINQAELDKCKAFYGWGDPIVNAQRAVEIFNQQGRGAWSVASSCNLINWVDPPPSAPAPAPPPPGPTP